MLLEQFDEELQAIINPNDVIEPVKNFPPVVVSCFSWRSFNKILEAFSHELIGEVNLANIKIPVYKIDYDGVCIGLFNAPVGASACASCVEELIAMGMHKLILFGTCGVLDASIKDTTIIIPTHALRDEGTSYHYLPLSDEIAVNEKHGQSFMNLLERLGVHYHVGKVWTTDAIYRETKDKLNKRKEAGCICVDMECSAIAAVAKFRKIELLHFFYSADNLDVESWDPRTLSNSSKLDEKHNIVLYALMYAKEITK